MRAEEVAATANIVGKDSRFDRVVSTSNRVTGTSTTTMVIEKRIKLTGTPFLMCVELRMYCTDGVA